MSNTTNRIGCISPNPKGLMIMQLGIFLFITLFGYSSAVLVQSCSKISANDLASVNFFDVQPSPVIVPGNITVTGSSTMYRPLTGSLDAELKISRRFGRMWIDLPCINSARGRLGSCVYRDICNGNGLLANRTRCPKLLKSANIPCSCPIAAGLYNLPPTTIDLDPAKYGLNIPSVQGEYQAILRITERNTMKEVYCLDTYVKIVDPPNQTKFGSIGRFFVNMFG